MYFKSVWDPGAFKDLDFTPRGEIIYPSAPSFVGVGQFPFSFSITYLGETHMFTLRCLNPDQHVHFTVH